MIDERETKAGSTARAHHAGDGTAAAPRRRRMPAKRKREAVLRILRGENLELVSRTSASPPPIRAVGVTASWRQAQHH